MNMIDIHYPPQPFPRSQDPFRMDMFCDSCKVNHRSHLRTRVIHNLDMFDRSSPYRSPKDLDRVHMLTKEDTEALDMYRRSFAIVASYLSQEDKQRLAAALEVAFQTITAPYNPRHVR